LVAPEARTAFLGALRLLKMRHHGVGCEVSHGPSPSIVGSIQSAIRWHHSAERFPVSRNASAIERRTRLLNELFKSGDPLPEFGEFISSRLLMGLVAASCSRLAQLVEFIPPHTDARVRIPNIPDSIEGPGLKPLISAPDRSLGRVPHRPWLG
jgi:hypothetical protein